MTTFCFLSLSLCLYLCLYFVAGCPFLTSITSTANSSHCFQDSLSLSLYFPLSLCPYLHLSVRLYLSLSSLWMPIFDPNHPQQQSNQAASKPLCLCLCLCICLCLCVHICIILCLPRLLDAHFNPDHLQQRSHQGAAKENYRTMQLAIKSLSSTFSWQNFAWWCFSQFFC